MRNRALIWALLPLCACFSQVGTENVESEQMWADFSVSSYDGETASARTTIFLGAPLSFVFVKLSDGDELTLDTNRGEHVEYSKGGLPFFGPVYYSADVADGSVDTAFTTELYLADDDETHVAKSSMPPPFSLDAPTEAVTFSRSSEAVDVAWSGPNQGDEMRVMLLWDGCSKEGEAEGELPPWDSFQADPASGSATIEPGTAAPSVDPAMTCTGSLAVYRVRDGDKPPGMSKLGSSLAQQIRSVSVTALP